MVDKVYWCQFELFQRAGFIVTNLNKHSKNVVKFYNGRGTAEQWIKEDKNAVQWTKLSYRTFKDNQTRLQWFALAYNLANFLRRLALPRDVKPRPLTTLRGKLVKIGAKVTGHSLLRDVPASRSGCDAELICGDSRPHSTTRAAATGCRWVLTRREREEAETVDVRRKVRTLRASKSDQEAVGSWFFARICG